MLEYQKAIDAEPDFYEANESKGYLLIQLNKPFDALKYFNKCIQIDSKLKPGYEGKGICLLALKKWKEAIENYAKLLEITTNSYLAYLNSGRCYIELKKFNEAIESLDEAIKIDPTVECYQLKGYALFDAKRYDDAVTAFKQAKRINPNEYQYDFYFSSSYLGLQKYEQCLDLINEILNREDSDSYKREKYIVKAEALWGLKKPNEAINTINAALREYPRDRILQKLLIKFSKTNK